uniref:Uncharacterized protein n=1 Tax=Onchocerca volvulus TaxID=6282 RepID=A0A8R1XT65_ONCVO
MRSLLPGGKCAGCAECAGCTTHARCAGKKQRLRIVSFRNGGILKFKVCWALLLARSLLIGQYRRTSFSL